MIQGKTAARLAYLLPPSHSQRGTRADGKGKKKKCGIEQEPFFSKKRKGPPPPPPNFSPFLRIPLTSVSPALAVDVPWSLLAKGYAACWIFTDKKKTSEFLSVGDKQDRRKPQRELQSITVTKLEDRGNMARPHQQNNTAQEWPRPRSLFLHHSTNFSKSINIGEQYGRTLQRPI